MPLVPGKSQRAIKENIEIERKIGKKPKKVAVAIALNEAAKSGYKPKSGKAVSANAKKKVKEHKKKKK